MQDTIPTKTGSAPSVLFGAALALLVALAPPPVAASSYAFTNQTTGSSSTNLNQANDSSTVVVTESSTSNSTNTINLTVDTGHNTITDNTTVGNVSTGDIAVDVVVDNEQNSLPTAGTSAGIWTSSTATVQSSNINTGANSTNHNSTTLTRSSSLTQNNVATASNNVNISANTGGNTLSRNTRLGNVTTGSVTIGVHLDNQLNTPPTTPPVTPPTTPGGVGGGTETPPHITVASIAAPAPTLVAAAPQTTLKTPTAPARYFAAGSNTAALPLILLLGFPLMAVAVAETGRWLRQRRRADRTLFRSWLLNTWVESALSDGVPLTGLKA